MAQRYGVVSYPTFQLVNTDGATISRWIGYDKQEVMRFVDAAVADATPIEARRARFEREPSSGDALALGRYHRSLLDYETAGRFLAQAQELATDPSTDHRYEIFETLVLGLRSKRVSQDAVRQAADAVIAYEGRNPEHVVRVAAIMTNLGRSTGDHDIMGPYLDAAVQVTESTDDDWLQRARREILVEHALFSLHDVDRAIRLRKELMPEGWEENPLQLNSFAWWCVENEVNLDEATALANRAVDLAGDRRTKANVLDTLAEISYAQGDPDEAVRYIESALELTPQWSRLPQQLARFKAAAVQKANE